MPINKLSVRNSLLSEIVNGKTDGGRHRKDENQIFDTVSNYWSSQWIYGSGHLVLSVPELPEYMEFTGLINTIRENKATWNYVSMTLIQGQEDMKVKIEAWKVFTTL